MIVDDGTMFAFMLCLSTDNVHCRLGERHYAMAEPRCCLPPLVAQVKDVLKQSSKQLGADLRLTGFVRVQVGEGLEAEEKDFAKEVEETLKSVA